MRIGIIAPPWAPVPPPLYGGIETVVDSLARGLAAAGQEVVLFATGDSGCPVERRSILARAEGERIHAVEPEVRHVLFAYQALGEFDVVHDHTLLGPLLRPQFPGPPVVTTVHSPFSDDYIDLYRHAARSVGLIAISQSQRRAAPDIPITRVIHHGVDPSAFPVGLGAGGFLLFLGRLSPDKGAAAAVRASIKAGWPLVLAGKMRSPDEVTYFQEEVRPLLGRDINYVGEVSHEEKLRLLSEASALLFPINWDEPFGMVMIEAMACGTPVLATPFGAAPEIVRDGETGFLCRDETVMAECIGRVESIDRAACRAAVEGYFSANRMVLDHLTLYRTLVGH